MAVEYLRPGVVIDPYSGEPDGEDWAAATRHPAGAAFVLSSFTDSTSDGTNATVGESWTLYIPTGSPSPGPTDRVLFDGAVFVQDGVAVRERNPFTGWAPYAQVRLRREGAHAG